MVAVIGPGASAMAERIAAHARALGAGARAVRVELRHASGATQSDSGLGDLTIHCHPDVLSDTMAALAPASLTVGAGVAFAAAVEADLVVWIRSREGAPLSARERAVVARARLVLDEPREGTALALARELTQRPSSDGTAEGL